MGPDPSVTAGAPAEPVEEVEFSADQVTYDSNADVVTASGAVRMKRDGNYLAADQVVWERKTGEVRALGNGKRGTHRGNARTPKRRRDDARERNLLALPRDQSHRMPEAPQLGDYGGPGHR